MKKLFTACLALLFMIFASTPAFAAVKETDLTAYLTEIGMSKSDLEDYLGYSDLTLNDFNSIQELKNELGEPVTAATLASLLKKYDLTEQKATDLLIENGELEKGEKIQDVYTFINDLDSDLSYYLDNELTPITSSNLNELLKGYDLTKAEFDQLMAEHKDSITNYKYIEDLDQALDYYTQRSAKMQKEMENALGSLGITQKEAERLGEYMSSVIENDPSVTDKLKSLGERMMNFSNFTSVDQLSAKDIAELLSIYSEGLDIFQLKPKFYLTKNGEKKELSLQSLVNIKDLNGANLLVELYSDKGELLLDLVITPEMAGSKMVKDTGKGLEKAAVIAKKEVNKPVISKPVAKTVKGAKLPKTAGNYMEMMGAGILLLAGAFLLARRVKAKVQ